MSTSQERRRRPRRKESTSGEIQITVTRPNGGLQALTAQLVDTREWGVGIETSVPLEVGSEISILGSAAGLSVLSGKKEARVVHCRLREEGAYRTGCEFDIAQRSKRTVAPPPTEADIDDYYEILQLSPNAATETIQRIYRVLAQRYHPDNGETGDEKTFQRVLQAYRVLSEPEKRASYDAQHQASRALRWKIFDQAKSSQGVEGEKRKRWGILSLLYTKMAETSRQPGMMLRDIEELLGCPREHLEFTLWYLKQKGHIVGPDNGRYIITAEGVDLVEEQAGTWKEIRKPLLLESSSPQAAATPQ
jgi:curved DNA-binding protein CbpA